MFARYLSAVLFDMDLHDPDLDGTITIKVVALSGIWLVVIVNCIGLKWAALLQKVRCLLRVFVDKKPSFCLEHIIHR